MRTISPSRADHILRALGWSRNDLRLRYNRLRGARHSPQAAYQWFSGRGLPEAVQVFLRLSVTQAQIQRGRQRRC